MWEYYEVDELRNTPSFKDGVDAKTECRYRSEGVKFIRSIGAKMELGYNTIATAVVFFHRFYMTHSFKSFPRYVTACSSLFLAGKAEETPKRCRDLVDVAKSILPPDVFKSFGENPKEEVMTLEKVLLKTINFVFTVEHPYKYLLKYGKYLRGDKTKVEKVIQRAWNFMNDSLSTTLCVQWEPELVAIALIRLATKMSCFQVTDWKGRRPNQKKWWDLFVEDLDKDILDDIGHQVLNIYSKEKDPNTLTAPSPISKEGKTSTSTVEVMDTTSPVVSLPNLCSAPPLKISPSNNFAYSPSLTPVSNGTTPKSNSSTTNQPYLPSVALPDFSVPPPVNLGVPPPNFINFSVPPPVIPMQVPFLPYKQPNFATFQNGSSFTHLVNYPPAGN